MRSGKTNQGAVPITLLIGTLLISIVGAGAARAAVDLTISMESVGDTVDQSPNLAEGGFAPPESKPRFQAFTAGIDWTFDARTSVSFSAGRNELNSLRDSFEINQIALSAYRRISPDRVPYTFRLHAALTFNYVDQLIKNSYTTYNGATLTSASISQPEDRTLSIGLSGSRLVSKGFKFAGRVNAGMISSDHESMQGVGKSQDDCSYSFSTDGSTGSLVQLETCGPLVSYSQQFANEDGVEDRLGFRSSQDVAHSARFLEVGGGVAWSRQSISIGVDYQFRQYYRDTIDERISENGDTPTTFSQTARAALTYRLGSNWSLSLASIYQTAPYLDEIPLLYTAFTSERYTGGDALSFKLSASLRL